MFKFCACFIFIVAGVFNLSAMTVDKKYSNIEVTGKYLNAIDVKFNFDDYVADLDVRNGRVNKIIVKLRRDSIDTGNAERDKYLKTKMIQSPSFKLTLSSITSKTAKGKIFVNGVLKTVMFSVKNVKSIENPKKPGEKLFSIQLSSMIRRKDFQLTDAEFDENMSPSLKINLNLVAKI